MIFRKECAIEGKFKFDVYSKDNQLKSTTHYVPNFITSTGLNYINKFPFADCFRYLSIGSGTGSNSIVGLGTTGLLVPISGLTYMGGGGFSSCIEPEAQINKYVTKGCGYRIDNAGITLSRAWRVPITDDTFFSTPLNFNEYMLSPGHPPIMGYIDPFEGAGTFDSPYETCGCEEFSYKNSGDTSEVVYGKEASDFYNTYPYICKSDKSFSRIIKNVSVNPDEYLVVNYSLGISFNTGVRVFKTNVSHSLSALGDVFNWPDGASVSGIYSLIHPGIKLIDNGDLNSVSFVPQIQSASLISEFRVGESFNPPLGCPMEPSLLKDFRTAYLSNDNLQFLVNDRAGGAYDSSQYYPTNPTGRPLPSGVQTYNKNWINDTSFSSVDLGGFSLGKQFFHTRSESWIDDTSVYPDQSLITDSVAAPFETIVGNTFYPISSEAVVVSDLIDSSPFTGRSRGKYITFQFKDPNLSNPTGGEVLPVRSIVYAYKTTDPYYFSSMDMILQPSGGPRVPTNNGTSYTEPLPIIGGWGNSGHFYLDINNILQVNLKLSWSSPCSSEVIGCP